MKYLSYLLKRKSNFQEKKAPIHNLEISLQILLSEPIYGDKFVFVKYVIFI